MTLCTLYALFFFFNDTATTEIYTLSLHDALPISCVRLQEDFPTLHVVDAPVSGGGLKAAIGELLVMVGGPADIVERCRAVDRKSTRLNSSHDQISYAVFCLKKKRCSGRDLAGFRD